MLPGLLIHVTHLIVCIAPIHVSVLQSMGLVIPYRTKYDIIIEFYHKHGSTYSVL